MNSLIKITLILATVMLPSAATQQNTQDKYNQIHYNQMRDYKMPHRNMTGGYYEYCNDCETHHKHGKYLNKVVSKKHAQKMFKKFINKHFKGYEIKKIEEEEVRAGTMYWVVIEDENKNQLELHMNPWGSIAGPFVK